MHVCRLSLFAILWWIWCEFNIIKNNKTKQNRNEANNVIDSRYYLDFPLFVAFLLSFHSFAPRSDRTRILCDLTFSLNLAVNRHSTFNIRDIDIQLYEHIVDYYYWLKHSMPLNLSLYIALNKCNLCYCFFYSVF